MNIARNVIWNWLALLVIVSTSFCISPFLVSRLGKADYGLWTLIISTIGYLGLVDFGMRTAVVKYVSQYHAVNDTQMLNKVLNSSFYLFFFLNLRYSMLRHCACIFFPLFFFLASRALVGSQIDFGDCHCYVRNPILWHLGPGNILGHSPF